MPITFKHATLDNGMTVLAEVDPDAHSASVGYFVKTGARDEIPEVMGVSHFLEHMMFKGTDRRSAEQLNQDFDAIGARNNAFTSAEMTCFYASVLPEFLPQVNEIIADMMRPALREEDFSMEKGVILEEIAMYDDNPFWVMYEQAMAQHYGQNRLGHRVLGTKETVTNLKASQMRSYFDDRYAPDNIVVALAGRVDFDAVVAQTSALCADWKASGATRTLDPVEIENHTIELTDSRFNRGYALLISPGPAIDDDRRYAASLLAQVLGGSDNSRLHWSLIEPGLADEAEAAYEARDHAGDFLVYVSADPAKLDSVWSVVENELTTLRTHITTDALDRIRSRLLTSVTTASERPGGRMQRLGRLWTYLGAYTSLEEELERIGAVTVNDLHEVLDAYPFSPRTTARLIGIESA